MLPTFFLYLSIFVLSSSFAYVAQYCNGSSARISARFLCFFVLFVPAALRYGIGTDYFNYVNMYERGFPSHMQILEPGFRFFGLLNYRIGVSAHIFIAIVSGITYALLCFCLPRRHIFVAVTFFVLSFLYLDSYNIIRQVLATVILLYAFSLMYGNKPKQGFILCLVASLMHFSSLIALVILLVSHIKTNNLSRFVFITVFIFVGTNEWFLSMLVYIAAAINPRNLALSVLLVQPEINLGVTYIIFALPSIFIVFNSKKILLQNSGNFILNANVFYIGIMMLAFAVEIVGRFVLVMFFVPLFSMQILFDADKKYAKIYRYILGLCFLAIYMRYIEHSMLGTATAGVSPYRSIFFR